MLELRNIYQIIYKKLWKNSFRYVQEDVSNCIVLQIMVWWILNLDFFKGKLLCIND